MAANSKANVSVAKGVAGGYCYIAPLGTTLPTDATTALANTYVNVGYLSDDGVTHKRSTNTTNFYDLNGDAVETASSTSSREMTLRMIEMNVTALKEVYGDSKVTEAGGVISYTDTDTDLAHKVLVLELVLKNNKRWRRIFPDVKVTAFDDNTVLSTNLASHGLTYTKFADASGNYEYSYIATPATSPANPE